MSSPGRCAPTDHRVVADRIQAATYLAAVAVTGGEVVLHGARREHMEMLLRRFTDMGLEIVDQPDGLTVLRRPDGCARSTSPRCRTRASPPTTSR